MRVRVVALALVTAGATVGVLAQAPQAPPSGPTFDVVSIKRHAPGPGVQAFNSTQDSDPTATDDDEHSPAILISRAYPPIPPVDMVGLPGSAISDVTTSAPRPHSRRRRLMAAWR